MPDLEFTTDYTTELERGRAKKSEVIQQERSIPKVSKIILVKIIWKDGKPHVYRVADGREYEDFYIEFPAGLNYRSAGYRLGYMEMGTGRVIILNDHRNTTPDVIEEQVESKNTDKSTRYNNIEPHIEKVNDEYRKKFKELKFRTDDFISEDIVELGVGGPVVSASKTACEMKSENYEVGLHSSMMYSTAQKVTFSNVSLYNFEIGGYAFNRVAQLIPSTVLSPQPTFLKKINDSLLLFGKIIGLYLVIKNME